MNAIEILDNLRQALNDYREAFDNDDLNITHSFVQALTHIAALFTKQQTGSLHAIISKYIELNPCAHTEKQIKMIGKFKHGLH